MAIDTFFNADAVSEAILIHTVLRELCRYVTDACYMKKRRERNVPVVKENVFESTLCASQVENKLQRPYQKITQVFTDESEYGQTKYVLKLLWAVSDDIHSTMCLCSALTEKRLVMNTIVALNCILTLLKTAAEHCEELIAYYELAQAAVEAMPSV